MMNFIRGGRVHAYFKGILRSIYTTKNNSGKQHLIPEYAVAHHALKNNIAQATNVVLINRYTFDEGSTIRRDNAETDSGLVRQSFGGSSTAVRQVVEGQSKRSRTAAEQVSKLCRTSVDGKSNKTRTPVEEKKFGLEAFFFSLTNFAPISKSLRVDFMRASSLLRVILKNSQSKTDGNSIGGRKRLEEGFKNEIRSLGNNADDAFQCRFRIKGLTFSLYSSGIPRDWFGTHWPVARLLFDNFPNASRSGTKETSTNDQPISKQGASKDASWGLAGVKKRPKIGLESAIKHQRNSIEKAKDKQAMSIEKVKDFQVSRTCFSLFYNQLHTNLYIFASLLRLRSEWASSLLRVISKGSRRGLEANLRKCRSWSGKGMKLVSNSQSVDQACVKQCICIDQVWIVRKTVPIYALSTLYQRFIYASSILNHYFKGALSQIRTSKRFNFVSCIYVWFYANNLLGRFKHFLNKMMVGWYDVVNEGVVVKSLKSIQIPLLLSQALKSLLGALKVLMSIRANALLVLMVSMFSLSAQTPRKDSGADGFSDLVALKPGDQIPDAVWEMSFVLHDFKKGAKTIKLEELKGKVILFDFWSTTCKSCIEGIPKMEELQKKHGKNLAIILVNSKRNKDTPQRLKAVFDNYKATNNYEIGLPSLLDDTVFTTLFPHNTIPTHAWIDRDGRLVGMNKTADEIDNKVQSLINGEDVNFLEMGMIVNQDRSYNPPLVDTAGKLSTSIFAKPRPNFLPTQKNVYYDNGHTYFQLGNHVLTIILQYAFYDELKDYMLYQFVFDPQLSNENQLSMYRDLKKKYWYELYHADSIDRQIVKEWVRADVKRYFQLEVIRKKELKDVYEVELTAAFTKIHLNSGMPSKVSDLTENEIQLNNMILFHFFNLLCPYLDRPVVIGDEKMNYFNLRLPKGFIHFSMDQKLKFLASQGILLKPVKKVIEYPYFKRTTNP